MPLNFRQARLFDSHDAAVWSETGFMLNAQILKRARRIVSRGGWIEAYAVQQHFASHRSPAVVDARMDFKLETCHTGGSKARVKRQPEWVRLFAELLSRKRANIQFGYVVNLPWGTKGLDSRDSLALIVESWQAMKPLLDAVRGGHLSVAAEMKQPSRN